MPQTPVAPPERSDATVLVSADAPADAPAPAGSLLSSFAMPLIIVGIFYFLLLRPQQKEAKAQEELLRSLQKGDAVILATGMHGVIAEVADTTVSLEISPRVLVTVDKSSVKRKANASAVAVPAAKGT